MATQYKNLVFDIGNVVVRWAPEEIIRLTFGDSDSVSAQAKKIFQSEIWMDLNKGFLTQDEAKVRYQSEQDLTEQECEKLFYYVEQTLIELYGSVDLIKQVKAAGYGVYALTDNVHEIVAYLKETYQFWDLFDGATVSADLGVLKPQPEIYHSLLNTFQLKASETLFFDDMPHNVEGAKAVGITGIQFHDAEQARRELEILGVRL